MSRLLLRCWHFFTGHPEADIWHIVEGGLECQGCHKRGKRL